MLIINGTLLVKSNCKEVPSQHLQPTIDFSTVWDLGPTSLQVELYYVIWLMNPQNT
jgi:hypothetical protein